MVTSAQAAAALLARGVAAPARRVLACAGPGCRRGAGAHAVFESSTTGPADAVVVGWHREFDFERLRRAADGVRAGARYVATNLDPTYPGATGTAAGRGFARRPRSTTAAGVEPEVAGKPNAPMVTSFANASVGAVVMIGDRPSTDGAFATALAWPFALVMSGVCGSPGGEPVPDPPPAFVADDLAALAPMLLAGLD